MNTKKNPAGNENLVVLEEKYKKNPAGNENLVVWEEKYTTGITLIDNQHKELIKLTNQLYHACLGENERLGAAFKEALGRMVEYVRFHFSAEQQLMERIKFPNSAEHITQHNVLVIDIIDAAKDFSEGKKLVPNQFVRTLRDWIFGHIGIYDKALVFYIMEQKKKGLLNDRQING